METKIERCRDYEELADVWLASVRATHGFLTPEDIEFYRERLVGDYMPAVELYALRDKSGRWCAFMGMAGEMVEMLFVSPGAMGRGYGSMLLDFAVREKWAWRVDVNEQNERALAFYQKHGFTVTGRDEYDGEGKPYPILHLELHQRY